MILGVSAPAWAIDFQSARTTGIAGAGRGGAQLTDTIFVNPSLMGFQPSFAVAGTFDWLTNPLSAGSTNHIVNGSIYDGKNPYVEGGLAFTRRPDLDIVSVGIGKQVVPWLSIGAGGKRFTNGTANPQAVGQVTSFDGGVSASVSLPVEKVGFPLQLGATVDNLIHTAGNEPYIGPRQYGAGFKASFNNMFHVYGDAVMSQSNFSGSWMQYAGGAELNLGNDFFVRGGLLGFRSKGWAYGAGWVGPKIALNYGFQTSHLDGSRFIDHVLSIDIFM